MHELIDFENHLKTISKDDWNKLFGLLIELKKNKENKTILSYDVSNVIVNRFIEIVYDLDIVIMFNWTIWKEGFAIINNDEQDYDIFDLITLCKFITAIVRFDRFCDGYLTICFNSGVIFKIINTIKGRVEIK
ncbi:MAG: DUF6508 domain-containing protein [Bacteroidales bacterium]